MVLNNLSPIILFCYRRLDTLIQVIESLKNNSLARYSDLIIFSDGWKDSESEFDVLKVRDYVAGISGFNSLRIYESKINNGLANSIINGVSEVLSTYKTCIVLEDDLVVSTNFLDFMNQGLNFYQNNSQIISICGYTPIIKSNEDMYFTHRSSSWGWATWSDRWEKVDWDCKSYQSFKFNLFQNFRFNKMGSDLSWMLWKQMHGKINSWAIRFCFFQFSQNLFSVHPVKSKVQNIGIGHFDATNTLKSNNRFDTELDKDVNTEFIFKEIPCLELSIINQFSKPNTFWIRIKYKFLS